MVPLSGVAFSRRSIFLWAGTGVLLAARLEASQSDFWNRKPPADWTPEEIDRLLKESPWAKETTPTYTLTPPPIDHRPWGEGPPFGRGAIPPLTGSGRQRQIKSPYQAIIRWESADPVRSAQKNALPSAFDGHYVLGIFIHNGSGRDASRARDLGSKPIESLEHSAVLLGKRAVDAEIVQAHPEIADGFLIGFPRTSVGSERLGFSARMGLLKLTAKFNRAEMLYHGQLAL